MERSAQKWPSPLMCCCVTTKAHTADDGLKGWSGSIKNPYNPVTMCVQPIKLHLVVGWKGTGSTSRASLHLTETERMAGVLLSNRPCLVGLIPTALMVLCATQTLLSIGSAKWFPWTRRPARKLCVSNSYVARAVQVSWGPVLLR